MSASREKQKRKELEAAGQPSKKSTRDAYEGRFSKKTSTIIKSVVAVVVVLALLFLIVVNSGVFQKNTTAATVGDHSVSPVMFNYFYWDSVNTLASSYGDYWSYLVDTSIPFDQQQYSDDMTWADQFAQTALTNAQQIYVLSDAAAAAGVTLSEDDAATADAYITSLDAAAANYGLKDAEDYLVAFYGKGSTVESFRQYVELSLLASSYSAQINDGYEYTHDDLTAYYQEHTNDFDVVTYRSYFISGAADEEAGIDAETAMADAKAKAEDMAAASSNNEDEFIKLALDLASEDDKATYEDADATLSRNKSYSATNGTFVSWLFDAARVPGETTFIESSTGYYVVWFGSRELSEYNTVDVRHILIQPATSGEDGKSTTDDWAAAEAEAQAVYDEYLAGDMTEDSFAALATANSTDPGSSSNGGLYEDVYKGQMVAEFEDWCFDESRAVGDTGIVKTDYGYHIMYYSGTGDVYWETQVDTALRSADYTAWLTSLTDAAPTALKSFGMLFVKD